MKKKITTFDKAIVLTMPKKLKGKETGFPIKLHDGFYGMIRVPNCDKIKQIIVITKEKFLV